MNNNIDIILVNSFAPRHRIPSDAALENGLAVIRTYLEDRDFNVYIVDEQRVSQVEQGVPKWCLWLLRSVAKLQLRIAKFTPLIIVTMLASWPIHSLSVYFRKKYMDRIIDNIADLAKREQIPIVGIKVWGGFPYVWSVKLAQKVKEVSPETTIIAGGPHVKVYGETFMEQGHFDLAIMGPGEEILEDLLRKRKTVVSKAAFLELVKEEFGPSTLIRTGHYSKQGNFMFSGFTTPRYRAIDMVDKVWFHTLVDGLGCTWNKCGFCSHTRQNTHYTPRPIEEIKEEILAMLNSGIAFFRFSSSETPLNHGRDIARMILSNGFTVNYSIFARPVKGSEFVYESYRQMIRSGLRAVFLGGETGHDTINDQIMNKGVVKQDILDTIQCIRLAASEEGASCQIVLSVIYPCPTVPGVSLEDIFTETANLIREANPDAVIVNPPGVFPGTEWFDNQEKLGFKLGESYIKDMMNYEYSVYKPVEFWPTIEYSLNDLGMKQILKEVGRLNKAVMDMGIPTNISDDYLMMSQAIGNSSRSDLFEFKKSAFVDIISGTKNYIGEITQQMNERSKVLATRKTKASLQLD